MVAFSFNSIISKNNGWADTGFNSGETIGSSGDSGNEKVKVSIDYFHARTQA